MRGMAIILGLALAACTASRDMAAPGYRLPPDMPLGIVVPRPDIEIGRISMGGVRQPDAERTAQARANLLHALNDHLTTAHGQLFPLPDPAQADARIVADYEALHRTVATAIALYKYGETPLPTKHGRFDWTLGPGVAALGRMAGGGDHALFVTVRGYESSDGRKAVAVAGTLGCFVGLCLLPGGGEHLAYASLVDLRTGDVIWFNVLNGGAGDPSTPEGAKALVDRLLATMRGRGK